MPTPDGRETPEEKEARLASPAQAPRAPVPKPRAAAGAGGFVNFAQRFGANQDVAKREAAKYGQQATGAVGAAQQSLGAAQQKFTQGVNTGTVQAPGGAPSTNTGAAAPVPQAAAPVAPQQPVAPPAPNFPTTPDDGQALTGESTRTPESSGPTIAEMLAKANQKYTGPAGLEGTEDAAQKAWAAQQQLDLLGSNKSAGETAGSNMATLVNESGPSGSRGADALSGALISSAGRKDFDALRAKFNPNKELLDAQDKATATAKQAKADSETNAKAWGDAATAKGEQQKLQEDIKTKNDAAAKTGRDAARQERASDVPATPDEANDPFYGIDKSDPEDVKQRQEELARFTKAKQSTTNDTINNAFEDFNAYFSPINVGLNAAGVRDPGQDYETKSVHPMEGADSRGQDPSVTNGRNIDWAATGPYGFYVWRNMTPDDWKTLTSKPRNGPNGQGAWVMKKAAMLQEAANAKRAAKAQGPKTGSTRG